MTDDRSHAYAEALLAVARSEGNLAEVEDELFRFARLLEGNDELRTTLQDLLTRYGGADGDAFRLAVACYPKGEARE